MRIKLKTRMAGPEGGAAPGAVVEVPEGLGQALVAGGFAEAVEEEGDHGGPPLQATVEAAERAVGRGQSTAGRRKKSLDAREP